MNNNTSKTILLVEDDALIALGEKRLLEKEGYRVLQALTGEQAVKIVCDPNKPVALILMDINLGSGMDGTQAARQILLTHDIPIIFLSSHTEKEVVDKTEEISSYGYVVKDSSPTVLFASIKMAFRLFEAKMKEKEKEEALRKSEERYHSFVVHSHEAIYCTEFDQPIDISLPLEEQIDAIYANAYMGECNQALVNMYGLSAIEDLLGQRMIDFHGGKDNPVNRAVFRRFIQAGYRTVDSETEEVSPNGEQRFFRSNDIGVVDNGRLLRIWGTAVDITERKKIELALQTAQAQIAAAFDNLHDLLFEVDAEGRIYNYHARSSEALYAPPEMFLGKTVREVLPRDAAQIIEQAIAEAIVTGRHHGARYMLSLPAGKKWFELSIAPKGTSANDGQPHNRRLIVLASDIAERKQVEDALCESQSLYESLVDLLPQHLYQIDLNGRLTFVNRTLQQALQKPMEEILGKTPYDFYPIEIAQKYRQDDQQVIQTGRPLSLVEENTSAATGKTSIVEVIKIPVFDAAGSVSGVQGMFWDVTERKLAEDVLRASEKRARAQRAAMAGLMLDQTHTWTDLLSALQHIVKVLSTTLEVARASIWKLSHDGSQLQCLLLYEAETKTYSAGMVLETKIFPSYFQAILSEQRIYTEDVQNDPRTCELTASYLRPLGITSMLDAGITIEGSLIGVVCSEHIGAKRKWHADEESFISAIGSIIALIFVNAEHRRTEAMLQLRMELLECTTELSLEEFMQTALDKIADFTESAIGFYHFVEPDQKTLSLQTWSTRTLQEFCQAEGKGLHYNMDEAGVWVDCVRQGKPIIHNNYASLPNRKGLPAGHAAVVRELVTPVFREGRVVAILGIGNKMIDYTEKDTQIVAYLADLVWEITQRKQSEEALRKSEERHRLISTLMSDYVYSARVFPDGSIISDWTSGAFDRITGYSLDEVNRLPGGFSSLVFAEDLQEMMRQQPILFEQGHLSIEYRIRRKDGEVRWLRDYIRYVAGEGMGKPATLIGAVHDITDQKQADNQIRTLLREKELLLKEVHHRIKNNMTAVASLLQLQSDTLEDPSVQKALQDAQARIYSMMVLYDKLYRAEDFRTLSLREYLPALMEQVAANFPRRNSIRILTEVEDIPLSPKLLSSLGIILNELTTNAMKYAFVGRSEGQIVVTAAQEAGEVLVTFADNGIGLPQAQFLKNSASFGMQLVELLVQQIDGSITVERGHGTKFVIRFAPG